ncbi:MAG TPA: phosphoglycolate phosphatase [Burkholderiaceae bacterium]|nr:phosphoglycolate phosphatase [Burkholderiaceae bacterium]
MPITLPVPAAAFDAAIVDLDGTMVDTLGDFVAVLDRVLGELALPTVSRAFVARTVGKGSEYLLQRSIEQAGGSSAALYEDAWAHYQRHYAEINGRHSSAYPGVAEGLAMLRARGWKLACLTNKPTAMAVALLERKGLREHFSGVFGGDAFERKKPDPLPLLKTCEALGFPPARTLMIGDSSNDARAARAAGCPVVLMSYGYNHGEPVAAVDADAVIDRIDQL